MSKYKPPFQVCQVIILESLDLPTLLDSLLHHIFHCHNLKTINPTITTQLTSFMRSFTTPFRQFLLILF